METKHIINAQYYATHGHMSCSHNFLVQPSYHIQTFQLETTRLFYQHVESNIHPENNIIILD
jgi:hypothetical protein